MNISFDNALDIAAFAVPAVIAITTHEAAHGFVADKLGDDTARRLNRVTFNPFRHIDSFGTIILPAILLIARAPFLFGWAKPVPVNFQRLRHPTSAYSRASPSSPKPGQPRDRSHHGPA